MNDGPLGVRSRAGMLNQAKATPCGDGSRQGVARLAILS